ncbi:MAG: alpha/beta hydrolase [Lentisphaerales bacterium]|nr:alpha/beta hydrolase [Lentisphaerales bacterium]
MRYICYFFFLLSINWALAQGNNQPNGTKVDYKAKNISEQLDVIYASYGDRQMKLNLFLPKGEGPFPGIALIHGGGWMKGSKEKFTNHGRAFADKGYVVAVVGYRLSTEAKFPAAIHDCKAAVRWLRANAAKFKLDSKRIAAVGGSAGGYLASLLSTSSQVNVLEGSVGNLEYSSAVQASVNWAGPVNNYERFTAENAPKPSQAPLLFFGGTVQQFPEVYKLGSPNTHIDQNTPPQFLVDSEFDAPPTRYTTMKRKLTDLGIPFEYVNIKGGKHGCWNRNPWFKQYIEKTDNFLKKHLK